MPRPKGLPKTGGRVKGSKNKRTKLLEAKTADGISPLDYMLKLMRNPKADEALRADMAKAAAPYLHARRAPEDAKVRIVGTMIYTHPPLGAPTIDVTPEPDPSAEDADESQVN